MKTKTFLILRVVQVPTGVKQVALQKWIALFKNPGFFVSGGQVFLSSFLGSLSRRVNSGSQEPRTAQCSLRVSGSLQPRGRWARSGSQQSAGAVVALRAGATSPGSTSENTWPAKLFLLEARSLLALVALLGCGSLAGRHGEEQRAPGGWRAPRSLPGALRQVRKFHRCVSENTGAWAQKANGTAAVGAPPMWIKKARTRAAEAAQCGGRGRCLTTAIALLHPKRRSSSADSV